MSRYFKEFFLCVLKNLIIKQIYTLKLGETTNDITGHAYILLYVYRYISVWNVKILY